MADRAHTRCRRSFASALVGAMLSSSCGMDATVHTRTGGRYEGYIDGSNAKSVYLRNPRGRMVTIPRSEITEVSHPGTAAIAVGAALVLNGVAVVAAMRSSQCERQGEYDEACQEQHSLVLNLYVLALFAVPGLGLATYGIAVRSGSVSRFGEPAP